MLENHCFKNLNVCVQSKCYTLYPSWTVTLQVESLERDILDIQSEFEFDRIDYLDTIRKQEKELAYLQV